MTAVRPESHVNTAFTNITQSHVSLLLAPLSDFKLKSNFKYWLDHVGSASHRNWTNLGEVLMIADQVIQDD